VNPIARFNAWYAEELKLTRVGIPQACCLSTLGLDGYPNARFVSLKEIVDDSFIITGPINSRKGLEIARSNKGALTFWWAAAEKQIRIQGEASPISDRLADKYFSERPFEARVVSIVSRQGNTIDNVEPLQDRYREAASAYSEKNIPRPSDWGGYAVRPLRMEFMAFQASRFHHRELYELVAGRWISSMLQP
jgi:pyridoxamine 5'-phosphate oxidase